MNELAGSKQRERWARARRQLGEVEHLAGLLRENLDAGLGSLEEYQRAMFITHCLEQATELAGYATRVAADLERVSWMEEFQ